MATLRELATKLGYESFDKFILEHDITNDPYYEHITESLLECMEIDCEHNAQEHYKDLLQSLIEFCQSQLDVFVTEHNSNEEFLE